MNAKEARELALQRLLRLAAYGQTTLPNEQRDYLTAMAALVAQERRLFRATVGPELHDVFYDALGSVARLNGHTKEQAAALLDAAERDDSEAARAQLRAYDAAAKSASTRKIGLALAAFALVSIVISLIVWNDRKHAESSSKDHEDRGAQTH